MLLLIALWLLSALCAFTAYCSYCYYGRQLSKIPGPPRWPLIGNAMDGLFLNPETAFTLLRNLHKTYGPICKMTSLLISIVHISDAEYAEKILSTSRFNEKSIPYNFMRKWLCEGLLVSNGIKWKQRRKLLTPSFHFTILKGFCSTFNEHTLRFLSTIDGETDKNSTSIIPIISRATLSVMCETSMGTPVNESDTESVVDKYFNAVHIFGNMIQKRIVTVWLHFEWIYKFLSLAKTESKLVEDMHALTDKVIQDRKTLRENDTSSAEDDSIYNQKHRLALLDLLLEMEKEGKIDRNGIREEVDTFMFEGHDTTAVALGYIIMTIANDTEVQERIYAEMMKIFGDSQRLPTVDDLNEMKYLECCIKECLRLYPSVPLIARYASDDVNLGKYTVPKGAEIFIHVYDIHRNPSIYPDPERFDPDRFLPENCIGRHPYAYIPFSAGPRNCIGQKFAMYEMKTLMSGLIRNYRLEPVTKPEDVIFIADLVLRSKNPLYVRFRRRKNLT